MLTYDEADDYRRLFFWYRYHFFIRNERFKASFDTNLDKLLSGERTPFFYIHQLAIDDMAHWDEYPELPDICGPQSRAQRGRPKKVDPGSFPAKRETGYSPKRDAGWEPYLLWPDRVLRKTPAGRKKIGDLIRPFATWEKSLLVYDWLEFLRENRLEISRERTAIATKLSGKTLGEAIDDARKAGVRPIRYDLIGNSVPLFPSWLDLLAEPADLLDQKTKVTTVQALDCDQRPNLLAVVADALSLAERLIESAAAGSFPR